MRQYGICLAALSFLLSSFAFAAKPRSLNGLVPDLDLQMTSTEIHKVLEQQGALLEFPGGDDSQLQVIMDAGKRNLDWLKFINQYRDTAHKISLSSAATQSGIPIDKPVTYNPQLIRAKFDKLMGQVPDGLKSVITGKGNYPQNPPVTDAVYVQWCHQIDSSYQMASRWMMMEPYLDELGQRQTEDVRGVYDLSKVADIESQLQRWPTLTPALQKRYGEDLTQICMNNNVDNCAAELARDVQRNQVLGFYQKYISGAKELWNQFFTIQAQRSDLTWKAQPEELHVPFTNPNNASVQNFLSGNIQDEWHWAGWHLLLDFVTGGDSTAHIVFVPGATPHVNDLGGDEITMDANTPLTEYDVQWTIRHEFGHVLGFPDCYVEFYDESQEAIVSYQLDVTNLMCSRQGHLQEKHYLELKRVYSSR